MRQGTVGRNSQSNWIPGRKEKDFEDHEYRQFIQGALKKTELVILKRGTSSWNSV